MILTVYVHPGAKENRIKNWLDKNTIKVDIAAAPEKGKANKALIKLLSKHFKISPSQIEIIHGKTTRIKQLRIPIIE